MNKFSYRFILLMSAMFALLTVSCVKETPEVAGEGDAQPIINSNIPYEIIAVINPDDANTTKTQYEGNVTFGWTNGDQVRMPVVKRSAGTIIACDFYTFTTSSASGSTSASFTINNGSADMDSYNPNPTLADNTWTSMGYLVYPYGILNKEYSGDSPVLTLPSSIAYNESTPLNGGVIPLIGRKDGETYKFSTAVGIIKVTITNAPNAGKTIKLVSTDKPLAGKFTISDVDAVVSQIANTSATAGANVLSLTGLSLTEGETYDFYFPVPVGTYTAGSLSIHIQDNNGMDLLEKTISPSLTINRNSVFSIPQLTYHRVYVKGPSTNPKLYTINPSTTIRTHIAANKLSYSNYNKEEWVNGNKFGANQNGWDLTQLKNTSSTAYLSSAGNYYLQYIVCSSDAKPNTLGDANVVIYGSVPFKYARTVDIANVYGTYDLGLVSYWGAYSSSTMTIVATDDAGKGDLKITSILGQSTALYADYTSSNTITFSEDQEWYIDGNSSIHRLTNSWDADYSGTWTLKVAAEEGIDFVLVDNYLVNKWFKGGDNGYDAIYSTVNCIKR